MILQSILAVIFVLGLLIFVHELGHFIVAKRAGVRVERFSLGYPPKLFGIKRGETEYCISWIPFGGYVKMAGENPDEEDIKGEPYEFQSKSVGARAAIIAAGPAMNFVAALIILWLVYFFSGSLIPNTDSTVIGDILPDGPAAEAGILPGDEITAVNGTQVNTFSEMADLIYQHIEEPIVVQWLRDGQTHIATITTMKDEAMEADGSSREVGKIGIGPSTTIVNYGIIESFTEAGRDLIAITGQILLFIYGLITGAFSFKTMGGPVLIAQLAGQTASQGFSNLLAFTALLSINLGLLNILPIPVLDGGHLVFLGIEKLRGKPLSLNKRMRIQQVGMLLLLLLMITVTYNDILRLFQ
ncbi:MAG: RIP metalloprotease RseP [candidate division Zixibacteria bacterium]|nr:RIP metalloprotease RseP [candidate division Zixibacteria bacterium]